MSVRNAARSDANEAEIIAALRAAGCAVWRIKWPVDLLVSTKYGWLPMEVKTKGGRLTEDQERFIASAGSCAVSVVCDVQGALRAAGVVRG